MAYKQISPMPIVEGGTNATSMATSSGIVKYDGTRLVTSSTLKVDISGFMTNTAQPAFLVYLNTSPTNVTGDGTVYTVPFNTAVFDQASNFNTGTGTFTAPVTGLYYLFSTIMVTGVIAGHTLYQVNIVTTGQTYTGSTINAFACVAAGSFLGQQMGVFASLNAGNTATFQVVVSGGTKVVGVNGSLNFTYAGGFLVC